MNALKSIEGMYQAFLQTHFTPEEVTALCVKLLSHPNPIFVHYEDGNDFKVIACVDKEGNEVSVMRVLDSYVIGWDSTLLSIQHLAACYDLYDSPPKLEDFAGRLIGVEVPQQPLSPLQSARLLRDVVHAMANGVDVIPF